ncbi:hypothetical protein ACFZBP_05845 [Streptomyces sp. NPDC008086]|uniref:hypothetical protein n=1 Tax=unclassified Streptomyces TaxID=2593676 RepID=UPI0036935257
MTADLATEEGVTRLVDGLAASVPDLLINNAGYGLADPFPFSDAVLLTTRFSLDRSLPRGGAMATPFVTPPDPMARR